MMPIDLVPVQLATEKIDITKGAQIRRCVIITGLTVVVYALRWETFHQCSSHICIATEVLSKRTRRAAFVNTFLPIPGEN